MSDLFKTLKTFSSDTMKCVLVAITTISLLLVVVGILRSSEYLITQPKTYEHVVKGAHTVSTLSPRRLQEALDIDHKNHLKKVIDEVQRQQTGHDRIAALRTIIRVSFEVPKYADIDTIFKNINLHLFFLTKRTVNVFDQLLPSVNIVHNYFALLEQVTTGENKEIFTKLHDLFRGALLAMAQEVYAEANFYQARGQVNLAHERMNIAQALVFRLKETNAQAKTLYNEIETHQPVPFVKQLHEIGALATGGLTR